MMHIIKQHMKNSLSSNVKKLEDKIQALESYIPVYDTELKIKNETKLASFDRKYKRQLLPFEINTHATQYFNENIKSVKIAALEKKLYWQLRKNDHALHKALRKMSKVVVESDEEIEVSTLDKTVEYVKEERILATDETRNLQLTYEKNAQDILDRHDLELSMIEKTYGEDKLIAFVQSRNTYYRSKAKNYIQPIPAVMEKKELTVSDIPACEKHHQNLYQILFGKYEEERALLATQLEDIRLQKIQKIEVKTAAKIELLTRKLEQKRILLEKSNEEERLAFINQVSQLPAEEQVPFKPILNLYETSNEDHLVVKDLLMQFGGLKAVNNLSFTVKKGEIFGLIGPNGAGKTTVFNCITQFYKPTSGYLYFKNKKNEVFNLNSYKVHDIIRYGIVRTFQNVELIWELCVMDNLLVGAHTAYRSSIIEQFVHWPTLRKEDDIIRAKAIRVLTDLNLLDYKDALPVGLPYGILKRIELARTLMLNPELIILDEPAAGLNDTETVELAHTIRSIRDRFGVTIFLVEHDMGLVMDICDTICAISFGKLLAIGNPKAIQSNPLVQEAYLGGQ